MEKIEKLLIEITNKLKQLSDSDDEIVNYEVNGIKQQITTIKKEITKMKRKAPNLNDVQSITLFNMYLEQANNMLDNFL